MIHGVINIDKESGFTSHDVVAKLRGITHQKKIGHTGTLDPDAQGVLPVCLGRGTKLCDMLTDRDKTYETVLLLGVSTDTQDISGKILKTYDGVMPDAGTVRACVASFVGSIDQVPPMYSALKVNGRKLYELAREGKTVERKSRRVMIHGIEILSMGLPRVKLRVSCSKGTYIRTLCHDIGEKLGCGGCMEQLVRTRSGRFRIEDAVRLSEVQALADAGRLMEIVLPVDRMFDDLPAATLTKDGENPAHNGNPLPQEVLTAGGFADGEEIRIYDTVGEFIGVYRYDAGSKIYKIRKMFYGK